MNGQLHIREAVLALPSRPVRADLLCEGHRIVAIGRELEAAADAVVYSARGLTLGPGFIDAHVHGGGGHSFFTDDPASVTAYAVWAPRHGVTAFLVSTLGSQPEETEAVLRGLRPAIGGSGAEPLGFHLEGPFINPACRGAFHRRMLRSPARDEYWRYHEAAGGLIRQVTFAPELPGALDLSAAIVVSGALAAIGHTDATAVEARRGFDAGARHVTHLFNAMRIPHHREGGATVAALLEPNVSCELICDGAHVAPDVLRMAFRLLGPNRTVVVTDNLHLAGTDAVEGRLDGEEVQVSGAKAVRSDGTIVGSLATMDEHFRNAMDFLAIDAGAAFRLCATNPARVVGALDRKGSLERGKDADLVLLDGERQVVATVCRGVLMWNSDPGRLS
ncbi:MAG: N-acetylglucosamine-6-phosphate deacetylase [Dehalococcoidia bacterium]|nr:N-acetylglucosamine-6-phosphate deacetylase [Dehalococcoidia bacterium]